MESVPPEQALGATEADYPDAKEFKDPGVDLEKEVEDKVKQEMAEEEAAKEQQEQAAAAEETPTADS